MLLAEHAQEGREIRGVGFQAQVVSAGLRLPNGGCGTGVVKVKDPPALHRRQHVRGDLVPFQRRKFGLDVATA
jgi:hypothetical protein